MVDLVIAKLRNGAGLASQRGSNDLRSYLNHVYAAHLGNQRNRSGSTRVSLKNVHGVVLDGVLHIHQTADVHLNGDLSGVLLDCLYLLCGEILAREYACRIAGVYAGKLDVLHNSGNEAVLAVGDGVCLALGSVVQEAVYKDRSVGSYANSGGHVDLHHLIIVNDLHSTAAENVGRTNHYRVADPVCDFESLVNVDSHSGFRHRNTELLHHCTEVVAILCEVDSLRACAEDIYAVLLEVACKIQRSLTAELRDNA